MYRNTEIAAEDVDIAYLVKVLWWNLRDIILVAASVTVLGIVYSVYSPKTYEAGFKVLLENELYLAFGGQLQKVKGTPDVPSIHAEQDQLASREIATKVFDALKSDDPSIVERLPSVAHLIDTIEIDVQGGTAILAVSITTQNAADAGNIARTLSEIYRLSNAERFSASLGKSLGELGSAVDLEIAFLTALQRDVAEMLPLGDMASEEVISDPYLKTLEAASRSIVRLYGLYLSERDTDLGARIEIAAPDLLVEVIDKNFAPTIPTNPNLIVATLTSLLVGVGAGIVYVLFTKRLEGLLFDAGDIAKRFTLPIWGDLAPQDIDDVPLASGQSLFRDIRSALLARQADLTDKNCVTIHSWSATEGVCDTKLASALASSYQILGKKVLILTAATAHSRFENFTASPKTVGGVTYMRLSAHADKAIDVLSSDGFGTDLERLRDIFDVIIFCTEGLGASVHSSLFYNSADLVVLNVVKTVTSDRDLSKCLGYMQTQSLKPAGIVLLPKSFLV